MNLAAVMAELSQRLETVKGLRVFGYQADSVSPPAAIVGLPTGIAYDETHGRGADSMAIPVFLMVGAVDARSSHRDLAQYADGSGVFSIKRVLEAGNSSSFDSVRVASVDFTTYTIAAGVYLGAEFTVNIFGQGD